MERSTLGQLFLSTLLDRGPLAAASTHHDLNAGGARPFSKRGKMRLALGSDPSHLRRLNRALRRINRNEAFGIHTLIFLLVIKRMPTSSEVVLSLWLRAIFIDYQKVILHTILFRCNNPPHACVAVDLHTLRAVHRTV